MVRRVTRGDLARGVREDSARPVPELLVVSNRLPDLRHAIQPADAGRKRSVSGLVSALDPVLLARRGQWLGWSGRITSEEEPGPIGLDDETPPALAWMDFPERWYRLYYNGFCNRALWPLFHAFPQHVGFADEESSGTATGT